MPLEVDEVFKKKVNEFLKTIMEKVENLNIEIKKIEDNIDIANRILEGQDKGKYDEIIIRLYRVRLLLNNAKRVLKESIVFLNTYTKEKEE